MSPNTERDYREALQGTGLLARGVEAVAQVDFGYVSKLYDPDAHVLRKASGCS